MLTRNGANWRKKKKLIAVVGVVLVVLSKWKRAVDVYEAITG